eukprot:scaffold85772_cov22-Cyclotella_meneghiniana.AAC.4
MACFIDAVVLTPPTKTRKDSNGKSEEINVLSLIARSSASPASLSAITFRRWSKHWKPQPYNWPCKNS